MKQYKCGVHTGWLVDRQSDTSDRGGHFDKKLGHHIVCSDCNDFIFISFNIRNNLL